MYPCPRGFYCPEGTGLEWKSCPPGTISNITLLSKIEQCEDCPPGKYCSERNATDYTGSCGAGHYCSSGVDREHPVQNETVIVGNCTKIGHHTGKWGFLDAW